MIKKKINREVSGSFQDIFAKSVKAAKFFGRENMDDTSVKTITFQVTENCNLCCTYCYQINKSKKVLALEDAKKFIDMLIEESYDENSSFYIKKTPAVVIEFIGGEPLLETKLIREIINYFTFRCINEKHPWAINHMVSMISNGVSYFSKDTEKMLSESEKKISFSISLDGNKELHDACRVFPNGAGSYDIAEKASLDYMSRYNEDMSTKLTISPYNIQYTFDALVNLSNLGYRNIYANCVYEEGWELCHAKILYKELKKVADYFLENDLENTKRISLFSTGRYKPLHEQDNQNYCGSTGSMICLTPNGTITPCIRFTKSSLGENLGDFSIGSLCSGIGKEDVHKKNILALNSVTRREQSTDECWNCPVGVGCGWCTALNYQETGSISKRVTHICWMHRAASLANVYYWNKVYKKNNEDDIFEMHLPKDIALNIIDEDEYNMLLELTKSEDA